MLLAMGISAFLCIAIGVHPEPLYALMPYPEAVADYHPYAAYHVVEQLQLLLWAVLAFAVLILIKWYPAEVPSTNLDTDWLYRVPGRGLLGWATAAVRALWRLVWRLFTARFKRAMDRIYTMHGPEGALARSWPTGFMALATAIVLGLALVIAFAS